MTCLIGQVSFEIGKPYINRADIIKSKKVWRTLYVTKNKSNQIIPLGSFKSPDFYLS